MFDLAISFFFLVFLVFLCWGLPSSLCCHMLFVPVCVIIEIFLNCTSVSSFWDVGGFASHIEWHSHRCPGPQVGRETGGVTLLVVACLCVAPVTSILFLLPLLQVTQMSCDAKSSQANHILIVMCRLESRRNVYTHSQMNPIEITVVQ